MYGVYIGYLRARRVFSQSQLVLFITRCITIDKLNAFIDTHIYIACMYTMHQKLVAMRISTVVKESSTCSQKYVFLSWMCIVKYCYIQFIYITSTIERRRQTGINFRGLGPKKLPGKILLILDNFNQEICWARS